MGGLFAAGKNRCTEMYWVNPEKVTEDINILMITFAL